MGVVVGHTEMVGRGATLEETVAKMVGLEDREAAEAEEAVMEAAGDLAAVAEAAVAEQEVEGQVCMPLFRSLVPPQRTVQSRA